MLSILTSLSPLMEQLYCLRRPLSTRETTMNILQVNSSARREGSQSTLLANAIVAGLEAISPGATVTVRDLAHTPHPGLDDAALKALFTPVDQHTPEQAARVAQDDALIDEIRGAAIVVCGVPMHYFGGSVHREKRIAAAPRVN